MQTVYCLSSNNGDGSSSVCWFTSVSEEDLEKLIDLDPESWGMNDCGADTYTFPDDLDLKACGFRFSDFEECMQSAREASGDYSDSEEDED